MQPRQIPPSNSSAMDNSMMLDNEMATSVTSHAATSPFAQNSGLAFSKIDESRPSTPPVAVRFATNTNAFGLSSSSSNLSPSSSISSINTVRDTSNGPVFGVSGMRVDVSPPSAGSITTRKLRRPSMLSLQQNISFGSDNSGKADDEATPMGERPSSDNNGMNMIQDPSSSKTITELSQQQQNQHRPNGPLSGIPFNSNTLHPTPRWAGHGGSFANAMIRRTSSAPSIPFEDLKTSTPPIPSSSRMLPNDDPMSFDMDENDGPTRSRSSIDWAHTTPLGSSSRKGKAKMQDDEEELQLNSPPSAPQNALPFTGKPLPNALLQTLASEQRPMDHEMQSEAKLQRFLLSHPQKLPLTPRAPKGSRGRFPDQVGGDDDDDEELLFPAGRRSTSWTATRRSRNWMDRARFDEDSDTESDEDDEENMSSNTISRTGNGHGYGHGHGHGQGREEPVNSAFAAGMDMDRPGSSSSSSAMGSWGMFNNNQNNSNSEEGSGKSTPPNPLPLHGGNTNGTAQSNNGNAANPFPTPPSSTSFAPNFNSRSARLSFSSAGQGMVPSPGYGLPSAFGGLGMGGSGIGTPLGSPTVERAELGASPNAIGVGSPGLMHYRESQGGQATVRPGKRKAQAEDRFDPYKRPRGTSPSLLGSSPFPISPSRTNAIPIPQSPSHAPLYPSTLSSLSTSQTTGRHTRPAHPYTRPMTSRSRAASPALSIGSASGLGSSLGNNGGRGFNLSANFTNSNSNGNTNTGVQLPQQLGGLGLLSLQNRLNEEDEKLGGGEEEEMLREDSAEADRMEED
ncbi:uncharacterized protein I303_100673 [Kwoniella dejecticola CBS 10117]|uniref:Uncharacterized protein n=1 Tax=Kwoniella dejecticola CBS 10117 TaxID=1296121 RepID=A0A1A6AFL3_9TREE|nr:uncharacterized protein I303_00677 [Kwoniella dejecticola CBS 10117]OBR88860.1 hypothetical protein I303_00677 [Kwoniella dejecticola CBS 10117]